MIVIAASHSKTELKTNDIIFVESIALQGVYYNCGLLDCLEVSEAKVNLMSIFRLARHQSQLFETRIRSKQVCNLPLGRIMR